MVQNMPGAGSVIAANHVDNIAKPDGLTIGSLNPGIYMDQLIGRKEVQFNWAKFSWLGTPEQTEAVILFRGDSPYKSIVLSLVIRTRLRIHPLNVLNCEIQEIFR